MRSTSYRAGWCSLSFLLRISLLYGLCWLGASARRVLTQDGSEPAGHGLEDCRFWIFPREPLVERHRDRRGSYRATPSVSINGRIDGTPCIGPSSGRTVPGRPLPETTDQRRKDNGDAPKSLSKRFTLCSQRRNSGGCQLRPSFSKQVNRIGTPTRSVARGFARRAGVAQGFTAPPDIA